MSFTTVSFTTVSFTTVSFSEPLLQLETISKSYPGGTQALRDINLEVSKGEIMCLLGPSGCGKTTLLRVVAGLENPDRGRVLLDGHDLAHVPVHKRGFGFMFQDFALFPHRTVAENVAFGLKMAGQSSNEQTKQVNAMLELVNLPGYGKRTIFELSGGERQRVALARSLAPNPALLMLDEPLGSLDRGLREELVEELRIILKELGVTALYVTHDQEEAMALGNRMVIMNRGRIEQIGTPTAIYTQPATPFVARFMGFTNLLPATPSAEGVMTPIGPFPTNAPTAASELTLLIRPEAARLAPSTEQRTPGFSAWGHRHGVTFLQGRLVAASYHGSYYRIEIDAEVADGGGLGIPNLNFNLPTFVHQHEEQSAELEWPTELPAIGHPIRLLIDTKQTTLLGYPTL